MTGTLPGKGMILGGRHFPPYRMVEEAVDLNSFCSDGNWYVMDTGSPNLPVAEEGFLAVRKTEDDSRWIQTFRGINTGHFTRTKRKADNSWSGWIDLQNPDNAISEAEILDALPVGFIMMWPLPEVPSAKWMVRNGDILNNPVTYAEWFRKFGNYYGGDGVNTAALPDDRGLVERGVDLGRGYDTGRAFGSEQEDAIRNITGFFSYNINLGGGSGGAFYTSGWLAGGAAGSGSGCYVTYFNASRVVPTANENRMRNRAYLPIIKVLP